MDWSSDLCSSDRQIDPVGGHAVIVNILAVGHIGDLGIAADAKRAGRALIDVLNLDCLSGNVWLAEAVGEQFLRNIAVLLADFHIEPFCLAMHDTSLGQRSEEHTSDLPTLMRISNALIML